MRAFLLGVLVILAACGGNAQPSSSTPASKDGTVSPIELTTVNPWSLDADPDPVVEQAVLRDVRASAHSENGGWDRVVFEFEGQLPAGEIEYQQRATDCATGAIVPVRGAPVLFVRFIPADAHDDVGRSTVRQTQLQGPGSAVVEVREACDFEGEIAWGIGMKGERPYKVEVLKNPTRVLIDIKWP